MSQASQKICSIGTCSRCNAAKSHVKDLNSRVYECEELRSLINPSYWAPSCGAPFRKCMQMQEAVQSKFVSFYWYYESGLSLQAVETALASAKVHNEWLCRLAKQNNIETCCSLNNAIVYNSQSALDKFLCIEVSTMHVTCKMVWLVGKSRNLNALRGFQADNWLVIRPYPSL